jgi:hypothetical protein
MHKLTAVYCSLRKERKQVDINYNGEYKMLSFILLDLKILAIASIYLVESYCTLNINFSNGAILLTLGLHINLYLLLSTTLA